MKKLLLIAACLWVCVSTVQCYAAQEETKRAWQSWESRPSCVLMKFTNATRFKALDSDEVFAELVLEKLLATRRFDLKEMQPIEDNLEKMLYSDKAQAAKAAKEARQGGKLHALFSGGNNGKEAASIANAKVGQFLPSVVTSAIGKKHKADYLIQGTIVNLGNGKSEGGFWFVQTAQARIGVVADLRIIRAESGEVIWSIRATGVGKEDSTKITDILPDIKIGDAKLNSNLYSRAMEDAAEQLVSAMLADMDARKLFFRERVGVS